MPGSAHKVFGIGLNKTGTKTLRRCLELLGFRKQISCRRDLLVCYRNGDLEPIFRVTDENETFEDWPFPLMYRELYERYGKTARYVLTERRSPEIWLDSLKAHAERVDPTKHCRSLAYGYDYPHGYEAEHTQLYIQHSQDVQAFFHDRGAQANLLRVCWEDGEGWNPLCNFLNSPVPDVPFPHRNQRGEPRSSPHELVNHRNIAKQLATLRH